MSLYTTTMMATTNNTTTTTNTRNVNSTTTREDEPETVVVLPRATVESHESRQEDESRELYRMLESSFRELSIDDTQHSIQKLTSFLLDSMSVPGRTYHVMDHVLHVAQTGDALGHLAGLFHDVVYLTELETLTETQYALVKDVATRGGSPCWNSSSTTNNKLLQLVLDLFVFQPTNTNTPKGWNEFLSALVAARLLEPILNMGQIAQIVICIEATIPFRHEHVMEDLHVRFQQTCSRHDIALSQEDSCNAIVRATHLANRDVDNFAFTNCALFLDKTWMLLPELNAKLLSREYSSRDYHEAMYGMYQFFSHLQGNTVFHSFRHVKVASMTRQATYNIEIAKRYLRAKCTSAKIMVALASLVEQEEPLATMVGTRWKFQISKQSTCKIPSATSVLAMDDNAVFGNDMDVVVYDLLSKGRMTETDFDIKESPLAAWLFLQFQGDLEPLQQVGTDLELLRALPEHVLRVVVEHLCKQSAMTEPSKTRLRRWLAEMKIAS